MSSIHRLQQARGTTRDAGDVLVSQDASGLHDEGGELVNEELIQPNERVGEPREENDIAAPGFEEDLGDQSENDVDALRLQEDVAAVEQGKVE